MGHLSLDVPLVDLTTAAISVWFRLPSATIAAVQARDASTDPDIQVMDHVVPIIMFGAQQSTDTEDATSQTVFCEYPPTYTIALGTAFFTNLQYATGTRSVPAQPSCIGIQCFPGQDPSLYVHIQPTNIPTVTNRGWNYGPSYTCPVSPGQPIPTYSDATFSALADGAVGNSNNNGQIGPKGSSSASLLIRPDRWHHLLLSWKLQSEACHGGNLVDSATQDPAQNISAYSKMYCALDDVNKDGNNLPATWVGKDTTFSDPNAIVCASIYHTAGWLYNPNPGGADPYLPPQNSNATATMAYGTIPSSPIMLPGSLSINIERNGALVGNQDIILGELQIFPGQLLDTSDVNNRRLFVTSDGKPASMALPIASLGAIPAVAISGIKNWKNGTNSGTAGNFSKVGTLSTFTPGPSLS